MFEEYFPRKFEYPVRVSDFAKLGVSQKEFLNTVTRMDSINPHIRNPQSAGLDLDINKIKQWMDENHKFGLSEFTVGDMNKNFVGRIDKLEFLGIGEYGNKQISFMHYKIPTTENPKFYDSYKIQLATYAFCLKNHPAFKDCDITEAKIIIKYPGSDEVKNEFIATIQMLEEWKMEIPEMIETACKLISGELKPKDEYFSLGRKHWVSTFIPKYHFSIN